jgi:hypothetical protein
MFIKIFLIGAAVFALLTLVLPGAAGLQVVAVSAVCAAAVLAALQSLSDGRYVWFSGFMAMAVLLNPIGPTSLTRLPTLALLAVCLTLLASWMAVVHDAMPSRSIAQVLYPRDPQ